MKYKKSKYKISAKVTKEGSRPYYKDGGVEGMNTMYYFCIKDIKTYKE